MFNSYAQLTNTNPDNQATPWFVGGDIPLSAAEELSIPILTLNAASLATQLPTEVYNNESIYFPPIFYQDRGSCVHAAEVGYAFTYEMNRVRDVSAGDWVNNYSNLYPPLFSFNYQIHLNPDVGSYPNSGFNILLESGSPMLNIYDDPACDGELTKFKYWMNEYDNYYSAMHNKIEGYSRIPFNKNYESLDLLKHQCH